MPVTLNSDTTQMVPVEVSFAREGRALPVDPNSPITWEVTSGDATVVPQPGNVDGTKVYFRSSDLAGTTSVVMTADAQLGDGVTPLSEAFEYVVADALADTVVTTVGAAIPKV